MRNRKNHEETLHYLHHPIWQFFFDLLRLIAPVPAFSNLRQNAQVSEYPTNTAFSGFAPIRSQYPIGFIGEFFQKFRHLGRTTILR